MSKKEKEDTQLYLYGLEYCYQRRTDRKAISLSSFLHHVNVVIQRFVQAHSNILQIKLHINFSIRIIEHGVRGDILDDVVLLSNLLLFSQQSLFFLLQPPGTESLKTISAIVYLLVHLTLYILLSLL